MKNLYNETIYSLFLSNPITRLQRARYPNGELSVFWNANDWLSPNNVLNWWEFWGESPKQIFYNLTCTDEKIINNIACINYSYEFEYSLYTEGYGGVCDLWDTSSSFWCGEWVAGGWSFEGVCVCVELIH